MKIITGPLILIGALACTAGAHAQNYPNKPIRLIEIGRAHV